MLVAVGFVIKFCPPTDTKELLEQFSTLFCSSTGTKELLEKVATIFCSSTDIKEQLQGVAIVPGTLILGSILSMSDRT